MTDEKKTVEAEQEVTIETLENLSDNKGDEE